MLNICQGITRDNHSLGGLFEVQCDPWKLYVLEPYKRNQNYCVLETKTLEGYTMQVLRKRREDKSFMRTVEFLRETDILTYNIKANTNYRFINKLIKDYTDFYGLPDITDTPLGNNIRMGHNRKKVEEQQTPIAPADDKSKFINMISSVVFNFYIACGLVDTVIL